MQSRHSIPREPKKQPLKSCSLKEEYLVEILHQNLLVTMELEKNLEHNTS